MLGSHHGAISFDATISVVNNDEHEGTVSGPPILNIYCKRLIKQRGRFGVRRITGHFSDRLYENDASGDM